VLDATKHQDDKIGRFLTGIAFLIAGALVFTNPDVLQARYAVGATHLRLPAIALITFMVLVILSVLLYVLAMAAPLTIPPPSAARRVRGSSHLFFLVIATETRESWRALWNVSDVELEQKMLDEYQRETLNIARRVTQKYERSNEASALFVVALLFFLLGTVLSVDVLQHAKAPTGAALQVPADLAWSTPLRATVATILALFAASLVYYRLRAAQAAGLDAIIKHLADGRLPPWRYELHLLLAAYPVFVVATLVPGMEPGALRETSAILAALAAVTGGIGYMLVLRRPADGNEPIPKRLGRNTGASLTMLVGVALAAIAWFSVHRDWPVWQLGLAVGAAVTPLSWTVIGSSSELRKRIRRHAPESAGRILAPDGLGEAGGDGGPA
jgi:hypothetical protein